MFLGYDLHAGNDSPPVAAVHALVVLQTEKINAETLSTFSLSIGYCDRQEALQSVRVPKMPELMPSRRCLIKQASTSRGCLKSH